MKYAVAAIPTLYRGRRYRSRLEARWAAMFDLLGWQAEYEPYDLGKWSPDFLLKGPFGAEVLVEVKPITEFDPAIANKAGAAVAERDLPNLVGLLIVGVSPRPRGSAVQFGWYACADRAAAEFWRPTPLAWVPDDQKPEFRADLVDFMPGWVGWIDVLSRDCGVASEAPHRYYPEHAVRLWAEATNRVQWSPAPDGGDRS